MKNLFYIFAILIAFTSCSPSDDDPVVDTSPVVVTPKPPVVLVTEAQRKSAIGNFAKSSTTSKISEVRKKLVKTITFFADNPLNQKYKIGMAFALYLQLPTDNVYDIKEDSLNLNTKRYDERIYTYNTDGNLEKITINNIAYPSNNSLESYKPIVFEYTTSGERKQITRYQSNGMVMTFEYNTIGQIIKAFDITGELKYTYSYDETGNISTKYLYEGGKPSMKYTYVYYPDNTYDKNWIDVSGATEKIMSTVKYTYNRNVEGVYRNEPLYKATLDNQEGLQFLHILSNTAGYKPKYFYDADGYLIKYDKGGQNNASDITIFVYE